MSFSIALVASTRTTPAVAEPARYDAEDFEYDQYVQVACEHLEAKSSCRFVLQGFGRDDWSLDLGCDLAVFLEQLPDLLAAVQSGDEYALDLYSQGVEQTLRFEPTPATVTIRCSSRTSWNPDPDTETVERHELEGMLIRLAVNFAQELHHVQSETANLEPFRSWRHGIPGYSDSL